MAKKFNIKYTLCIFCLIVFVYVFYTYGLSIIKKVDLKEGLDWLPLCNNTYPRIIGGPNSGCPDGFVGVGCKGGCPPKPKTKNVSWANNCGCWPELFKGNNDYAYSGNYKEMYDTGLFSKLNKTFQTIYNKTTNSSKISEEKKVDNPDPCLSEEYAKTSYLTCCANGGYKKKGHSDICTSVGHALKNEVQAQAAQAQAAQAQSAQAQAAQPQAAQAQAAQAQAAQAQAAQVTSGIPTPASSSFLSSSNKLATLDMQCTCFSQ